MADGRGLSNTSIVTMDESSRMTRGEGGLSKLASQNLPTVVGVMDVLSVVKTNTQNTAERGANTACNAVS